MMCSGLTMQDEQDIQDLLRAEGEGMVSTPPAPVPQCAMIRFVDRGGDVHVEVYFDPPIHHEKKPPTKLMTAVDAATSAIAVSLGTLRA